MLNYIWSGMIIISLITAFFTGRISEVSNALMTGANDAITMTISLMGMMCLWTGIMNIAENTGVLLQINEETLGVLG